jgi:hypothetical protein
MGWELINQKNDRDISKYLDEDGEIESISELTDLLETSEEELSEKISNHFYLSPLNIYRGQLLLALVCFCIVMAISVVRFGNDFNILIILGTVGLVIGLPYLIFYLILKYKFSLRLLQLLSFVSFGYSLLISLLFITYASLDNLFGLMLIPVLLLIFYLMELRKLAKLFNYLNEKSQTKSD